MSPFQSSAPTSPSSLVHFIQQNWSLATPSSIVPSSLLSAVSPTTLPHSILYALFTLSSLTPNQPDRAYSLLNTYLHARIREGSYKGTQGAMVAGLEVADVEAACESVRRMMRGREMQGVTSTREGKEGKEKRKYSIRQELDGDEDDRDDDDSSRASKAQKLSPKDISSVDNDDEEAHAGPSPSQSTSTSTPEPEQQDALRAPITLRTKRLIHLPPIRTSHITTPVSASLASTHMTPRFTPLFNTLKQEVGYTYTPPPIVYTPHPLHALNANRSYNGQRQQRQAIPQHHFTGEERREKKREQRLHAAQRATHDFNLLRLDTERLGRAYEDARARCEDARQRMEELWWRAGWRG